MRWILLLIVLLCCIHLVSAQACGDTIQSSVILNDNLSCSGDGLTISAPNVILDCRGRSIGGSNDFGTGIMIAAENITVENCIVQGFDLGVNVQESHFILNDSIVEDNVVGIRIEEVSNIDLYNLSIRNNVNGIYNIESSISTNQMSFENNVDNLTFIELPITKEVLFDRAVRLEFLIDEDEEIIDSRIEWLSNSLDELEIEREFVEETEFTTVILKIRPKNNVTLLNVSIYEKIPKCFAQTVESIVFDVPVKVIDPDPTVKIILGDINEEKTVSYNSNIVVSEDCKNLFQAVGAVEDINKLEREKIAINQGFLAVIEERPKDSAIIFGFIVLVLIMVWYFTKNK